MADNDDPKTEAMGLVLKRKLSRNGEKYWYSFEYGKGRGQRISTGAFTYVHPRNQPEREHNKAVLLQLELKKAQLILDYQGNRIWRLPNQHAKENFLSYYEDFVQKNKRKSNRHLEGGLEQFKTFIVKRTVSFQQITANLCLRFKNHLLEHLSGMTPSNYFGTFKRVLYYATKEKYFESNPAEGIRAKSIPRKAIKAFLEADEYPKLFSTPIENKEVQRAFIFCSYTGLRWCDIKTLRWDHINAKGTAIRFLQRKTGVPAAIDLHPVAQELLHLKRNDLPAHFRKNPHSKDANQFIFQLPTANGANKILGAWARKAGIQKHLTWHSARLSFSILLQDANVDPATVALLLGHTSTKYVNETYKRHRPKDQTATIQKLPDATIGENDRPHEHPK